VSRRPTDSSNSGPFVLSGLRDCKLHQRIHPTALCLATIGVSASSTQLSHRLSLPSSCGHQHESSACTFFSLPLPLPLSCGHCCDSFNCTSFSQPLPLPSSSNHQRSSVHPSHCLRLPAISVRALLAHPSINARALTAHPSDCLRHYLRLAAISARASLVFSSHLGFLWARSSTLLCCLILSREFYPLPATCDIWCCHIYSTGALRSTKLLVIIIVVSKTVPVHLL